MHLNLKSSLGQSDLFFWNEPPTRRERERVCRALLENREKEKVSDEQKSKEKKSREKRPWENLERAVF